MEQSPQGILSLSREHTHAQTCKGARAHASACTLPPSHTHACTQIRTNTHTNSDLHEPLHLVSGQIDAGLSRLCDLCGLAKFSCNAFPLPNVIPARRLDTDDEPGTRADSRATVSCPGIHRQIPLQLTSSCRSLRQDGGKRRADSAAERLHIRAAFKGPARDGLEDASPGVVRSGNAAASQAVFAAEASALSCAQRPRLRGSRAGVLCAEGLEQS